MSHAFTFHSHDFIAHPSRALEWPAGKTLFISDLHLGKAATFRAHGIALPGGTTAADLQRLSGQITASNAQRLVILGDFFHAAAGRTTALETAFLEFRQQHAAVDMLLIRGNHDVHAGPPPLGWNIQTQTRPFQEAGVLGCHEPDDAGADAPWIAGHIHPVAWLGSKRERLRLPCFWIQSRGIVLPAFTEFAGGQAISAAHGEQRLGIAGDRMIRLPMNA
jgi:uncharacterized protein